MGRTACTEPQFLYKGALYFFKYRNRKAQIKQLTFMMSEHSIMFRAVN